MAEFTRGNWILNPLTAMINAHSINTRGIALTPVAYVYNATTLNSPEETAEPLANARLIENAPYMFALLDHIAHELRETNENDNLLKNIDYVLGRISGDYSENAPTLKPCPFCRSNKHAYIADYGGKFAVECPNCDCSTRLCDTRDEAIDAWNMRDGKEDWGGDSQ